jgi:hypothetical protein
LVAATVRLEDVGDIFTGSRPDGAGPGPKIHVDPRVIQIAVGIADYIGTKEG